LLKYPDRADPAQPPHDFSTGSPLGQAFGSKAGGGSQTNEYDLIALGQLGLGEKEKASTSFQQALELHPAHLGAHLLTRAVPGTKAAIHRNFCCTNRLAP